MTSLSVVDNVLRVVEDGLFCTAGCYIQEGRRGYGHCHDRTKTLQTNQLATKTFRRSALFLYFRM